MEGQKDELLELLRAARKFRKHDFGRMVQHSLKPSQMAILCCIFDHTGDSKNELKPSQISVLLGVQQPTITPLLRSLEVRGLLIRRNDDVDRRQVYYSLDEKAYEMVLTHQAKSRELLTGLFEYLGKEDSEKFVELMKKSMDYLAQIKE